MSNSSASDVVIGAAEREREELHHSQRQPVRTIVPFFVIVRAGGHVERVRRGEGLRGDGLAADED